MIRPGSPLGIKQLYDRYKKGNHVRTLNQLLESDADRGSFDLEERWMVRDCVPTPVKFTGVWDTVGSVPTSARLALLTGGDHSFLDVNLRKTEEHVYHAMAIDENRADFDVTLLSHYRPNTETTPYVSPRPIVDVEQRWFCGAHGDVGGGTYSDALAQLPLKWLLSKASSQGLAFKRGIDLDAEATTGKIEDSFADFLGGAYKIWSRGKRNWRPIGREPEPRSETTVHTVNETIDKSVFDRCQRDEAYRPQNLVDWAKRHNFDIAAARTSIVCDDPRTAAPD